MENTLGLRDNPFDPNWRDHGRRTGEPLAVDTDPELMDLLCWGVAGFQRCDADLKFALFGDGSSQNAPVRRNLILVILGVRGSGRSTLANLVRTRIYNGDSVTNSSWRSFEAIFLPYQPAIKLEEVEQKLSDLRKDIVEIFGEGRGQALVLIDNMPKLYFDQVLNLYHSLPKLSRVFIVTTDDETLKERDLDAAGPWIEIVERPKLTSGDVRAFIADRVPKFYSQRIPKLDDPQLALYPFIESAADKAVGGASGSKPMRAVIKWLIRQLEEKHRTLSESQDLLEDPALPASLSGRLIG